MSIIRTTPPFCASTTTTSSFHASQRTLGCLSFSSLSTHPPLQNLLSSTANRHNLGNSYSLTTRKLLCKPLSAKHIREDYIVKKVSSVELQELVRGERKVPIIVDFYATWCGPCVMMAQMIETLAVGYQGEAIVVKVDTDEEYEFARDMQVRGLPTVVFISPNPNKDAIRTEGLVPMELMVDIINNEIGYTKSNIPIEDELGPLFSYIENQLTH